jgi:pectin methylesterase-like acyl-CoA thioesterase
VSYLFPPPQGMGVCPDPPLRIRFPGAPTLGTSGKIQVYGQGGNVVASVDMAAATVTDSIGGTTFTLQRPAFVDGNDAVVYLKTKALTYGQTYYVTVDSGAIRPPGGAAFSITGSSTWRFTTAPAAPADLSSIKVALDGAGPFCSVQGATDVLPANNTKAAVITINAGTYHEIVHMRAKSNVTLHGADRKQTIIAGTNNNNMNASTATRSLVGFDSTNGLIVENLTIHNLTPQGGSQAEALRLQGCDKCVVRDADILSLQDTLLWSGRIYANNCYIAGNVDYIWGTGVVYFNKCEIHTVGRTGVIVQSRNAAGAYGYVFVDSKLTADAAASNNILARIDASMYPGSHVAYINCQMTNVAAAGWTITGAAATSALRFWEYQSVDAAGNALSTTGRVAGSSRISSDQAAMMRDPTVVLGGWQPPN